MIGLASLLLVATAQASDRCEALAGAALDHAEITTEVVAAGAWTPPGMNRPLAETPAFCRVTGTARPVAGSEIGFEVWLPLGDWTGRLRMSGNGGYSSALPYFAMGEALRDGAVAVGTDTGHTGDDPDFAIGRPEAIVDWGHRAVHVSVVQAKAVVNAFYGRAPDWNYFNGCSTGGHQALMEAQRYPDDFDGVLAGAPGNYRTRLNAAFLWQFVQNHDADGGQILPQSKLPIISQAAIAACRRPDDDPDQPWVTAPQDCTFDPAILTCAGDNRPDCLTTEQVVALRSLYSGAINPRTGERIAWGWPPGSEAGWAAYWADPRDPTRPAREGFWRIWAFNDADWTWRDFDFDADWRRAHDRLAHVIDADDPDLSAFRAAGGKLIQWHGGADPVVPLRDSIAYVEAVRQATPDSADFHRLVIAPGVSHCVGGAGAAPQGLQAALEAWVEAGQAPERLETRFADGRPGRPLYFERLDD
ncbi:tannase/feruloyl esterase family alpha/beta hydrolase [Brevundimonas sp.]|uniref:tannase/feruloyl esterase family alpha/beta hydrolase n=1 Tax=Brevundimonas sp. TaxID=1871086 RepID=UPI0028A84869|nr:tannase/feruloyl esterase family alpha/beta hydrolase [Brevundimonas sp.]